MRSQSLSIPTIDVKKYGGKQVALVKGRIVASGKTTVRVIEQAKRRIPKKYHGEIWIFAVPRGLPVIYHS